jgi:hypothetical protein
MKHASAASLKGNYKSLNCFKLWQLNARIKVKNIEANANICNEKKFKYKNDSLKTICCKEDSAS